MADTLRTDPSSATAYARDPSILTHRGGDVGVLLLHGFNGVPGELRSLYDVLIAQGYSVDAPLLAGHGGTPEQLAASTWPAWVASAAEALARLHDHCSSVVVVGFSTGGAIALHLAAHGARMAGVVTISTPTKVKYPLMWLLPVVRFVVPYVSPLTGLDLSNPAVVERLQTALPGLVVDLTDRAQHAEARRSVRISLQAVYQMTLLLRVMSGELRRVRVPALLVQARDDEIVPRSSMATISAQISSSHKVALYLLRGGHMVPVGPMREIVAARVLAFVRQVGGVSIA